MSTKLRPPSAAARSLLRKLEALAERGIDGERLSAQKKIARLKARYDFQVPDPAETPSLFSGKFRRSSNASRIGTFAENEVDVANAVKWAIEAETRIPCFHRKGELVAEATPATIAKLIRITTYVSQSFRALLQRFSAIEGVSVSDRAVFAMGLYDGMMNETRAVGQRLPSRPKPKKTARGKKAPLSGVGDLGIHPYTLAVELGKQIRLSAPLAELTTRLDAVVQRLLDPGASPGKPSSSLAGR